MRSSRDSFRKTFFRKETARPGLSSSCIGGAWGGSKCLENAFKSKWDNSTVIGCIRTGCLTRISWNIFKFWPTRIGSTISTGGGCGGSKAKMNRVSQLVIKNANTFRQGLTNILNFLYVFCSTISNGALTAENFDLLKLISGIQQNYSSIQHGDRLKVYTLFLSWSSSSLQSSPTPIFDV